MQKTRTIDTTGKAVFVGIDVHKKTYAIAACCEGMLLMKTVLPAEYAALEKTLKRAFPSARIKTAYEAGFAGFGLHRFLKSRNIECSVVNPASIFIQANNQVKTDKRDAMAIAQQLSAGMLEPVYIPSIEEELHRSLSRSREALVKDRTRLANRIKAKLHEYGYPVEDKPLCLRMLKEIQEIRFPSLLKEIIDQLIQQFFQIWEHIKNVEKKLASQASEDPQEAILRSIPGIGQVTSRVISNEIIDFRRFSNNKKLASFCGLTPREYSSGEHTRRGGITKQGSAILRRCLIESSWIAIKKDAELKSKYEKLKKTRGGRRAIVAVARHLLVRARSCLLKGRSYKIAKTA